MSDYYVREENGVGHYVLEDGTGDLILEAGAAYVFNAEPGTYVVTGADVELIGPIDPTRISQVVLEAVVAPIAKLRASQAVLEAVVLVNNAKLRASQLAAEFVVLPTDQKLRASTVTSEVIVTNRPEVVNIIVIEYRPDDA